MQKLVVGHYPLKVCSLPSPVGSWDWLLHPPHGTTREIAVKENKERYNGVAVIDTAGARL